MHGRNHVFGQPALDEAHPGGGADAITRPVVICFPGTSFSAGWKWQHFEWPKWPPRIGCAWDSNLHGGLMHSSPFSGGVAHCAPLLSSLTKNRKECDGDNADGEAATGRRAAGWQCAKQAYMANQPRHTAATPDLLTTIPTPPLPACSSSSIPDCIRPQNAPDRSPCLADRDPYRITTPHHTSNPIHSARSYFTCLCPACPHRTSHRPPSHTCLFVCFLLGVCSGFAFVCAVLFSNFVFLTFFFFGGIFGYFWFGTFLFVVPYFCDFLDSLHFQEFLVLVDVLDCSIVEKVSINLRPSPPRQDTSLRPHTSKRPPASHPTTPHSNFTHNHTLPTHPRTQLSHPPPQSHPPHSIKETFV